MKQKIIYQCTECGYTTSKWMGKCPECGEWNSFAEKQEKNGSQKIAATPTESKIIPLRAISGTEKERIYTDITEFDRVMGGGIVPDSVTIITSPPGGGKSTLALSIGCALAKQKKRVLYASGEESASQIKNRADRILADIQESIWVIADTSMNKILNAVEQVDPDFIVLDSIQTVALEEYLPSRPGNPTQTMECAQSLVQLAKNEVRPRAVLMIGQMNKNDEIAGLRALEHLVDTVLVLEGEGADGLRSLSATKNRFGNTGEIGFFTMTEKGLFSIDNPSEIFMSDRKKGEEVSGAALTVLREGSRPIVTEVESLVSKSFTPYPSRISESMKKDTLNTLISVLEQRGGVALYEQNVVVRTAGGLKLKEQAANLAVIVSIASSLFNRPLPTDWAFLADVSLTGELKRIPALESRIRELDRMGFTKVFTARGVVKNCALKHVEIVEFHTLSQIMSEVFGKK